MFPRERVEISFVTQPLSCPSPSPRMEDFLGWMWWHETQCWCLPMDQSSVAWVPVCPVLRRAGRTERDLGSIPVGVKPAVAALVCLGTHMLYDPICLLPTHSWLSGKNKLVIGLSSTKLVHIKQGSFSSDSSPSCIEAQELGGLTTFSSALLAHLGRLISRNTESHLFSSSSNNRNY